MTATATGEIVFDTGLPGFPDAHRFALLHADEEGPFALLRCLDAPELEFVVVPPGIFFGHYQPEIDDATAARLELRAAEDAAVYVILTLADDPTETTANLLGPIVVNRHTNRAAQVVLAGSGYDLRARLLAS